MVSVENSIVVNLPLEEVFAIYADPRNHPQWEDGLLEVQSTPEGPIGTGTQIREVRKFLGRKSVSVQDVIEYVPNAKIWFKVQDPFPGEVGSTFESTAGGTKVTTHLQLEIGGFFGLTEPLVASSLRRGIKSTMSDFKDLIESGVLAANAGARS